MARNLTQFAFFSKPPLIQPAPGPFGKFIVLLSETGSSFELLDRSINTNGLQNKFK